MACTHDQLLNNFFQSIRVLAETELMASRTVTCSMTCPPLRLAIAFLCLALAPGQNLGETTQQGHFLDKARPRATLQHLFFSKDSQTQGNESLRRLRWAVFMSMLAIIIVISVMHTHFVARSPVLGAALDRPRGKFNQRIPSKPR